MADTPSSILLLRLQSTGSNTNLWGGYLNTALQMLEQASKGYQALVVSGDATISWTNYATGNVGACARLKLTGSPAAACTLTLPSYQNFLSVENTTSVAVTLKCSGGTGVSIAAGGRALLYCDGVDYYNAAATIIPAAMAINGALTVAGRISGVTAGVAGTDGVNLTQMQAAIAVLATAQSGLVLNSLTATTAKYLEDAISVAGSLVKTKRNAGTANETTEISFTFDEGNQVLLGGVLAL